MTKAAPIFVMLATLLGCSELDNCPEARDPIEIEKQAAMGEGGASTTGEGGAATTITEALVYESAPWDGPRDAFPAKTCLRFVHGLGVTPKLVTSYVSFSRTDTDVTENAGNQGRIKCVDDREIVIMNDTCEEDFFIRVVAQASGSSQTGETCHARVSDLCTD